MLNEEEAICLNLISFISGINAKHTTVASLVDLVTLEVYHCVISKQIPLCLLPFSINDVIMPIWSVMCIFFFFKKKALSTGSGE